MPWQTIAIIGGFLLVPIILIVLTRYTGTHTHHRHGGVRVTWQSAVIILSLVLIPIAFLLLNVFTNYGDRDLRICIWSFVAVAVLFSFLAIQSRLSKAADAGERVAILKQVGFGFVVLVAAVVITLLSMWYGIFSVFGSNFYLIPSGMYLFGFFLICKAMLPQET